jgi:hypothetical protein
MSQEWTETTHSTLGRVRYRLGWNLPKDAPMIEMQRIGQRGACVRTGDPSHTEQNLKMLAFETLLDYLRETA